MKKLLIFTCLILLFSLISCQTATTEIPSSNITDENETEETDFRKPRPIGESSWQSSSISDALYHDLEYVIDATTHIIVATYIEKYDYIGHCEYKFSVKSQIKGRIDDKYIYVYCRYWDKISTGKGATYSDGGNYKSGNDYILLLSKDVSVYFDHDRYSVWTGTFFPTDSPEDFAMFRTEPVAKHSSAPAETFSSTEIFIEYLKQQTAADTTKEEYGGREYTRSTDMETIVDEAEYVLRIIPRNLDSKDLWYNERWTCDIVKQYKGKIELSSIIIDFLPDTVELEQECIVTLVGTSLPNYFDISARNSVIDIGKESVVMEYIAN